MGNCAPYGEKHNDQKQQEFGYKLHIVYGCLASPSERSYSTVNDSPEAISFSYSITTTPVDVAGFKSTSIITVDSTKTDTSKLAALESILYGTGGQTTVDAKLPLPAAIITALT